MQLLAPNGKPSNLTPEQYRLVRTSAFKKWFGDWENAPETASKVVDENGEPLVLNRGNLVNQEDLGYTFNLGQNFLKKQSGNKFGFFFTNEIDIAKKYMLVDHFDEIRGGSITSVFMKSNKILDLLDFDLKIGQDNFVQGLIKKGIDFNNGYNYLESKILDFNPDNYKYWGHNVFDYFDVFPELRNLFMENGFNSVVFYEMSRTYSKYKVYVAFESKQIKLADGSNTTFRNNPDIRYKDGGKTLPYVSDDFQIGYNGAYEHLIAPNGKPSNLTPEQYKLVRTPEFISWFGDWQNSPKTASKVVDENGEPLIVYHGTSSDFNIFSLDKVGSGTKANLGNLGVFFTDDKTLATDFTRKKWTNQNSPFKKGARVVEVFLKIINPKYMTIDGFILMDNKNRDKESVLNFRKDLLKKGYNGIIVEKAELYWQSKMREFDGKQYIVLENNKNIKLADGSNTIFDRNNPDIRYKDGGNTTQDFWAGKKSGEWFSRKLRIDQLRIGKEFLLARRNFKLQKNKVDEQQEPVWSWQHRDSVYDEKGMAIGNDWYNNITDDVLLLSDLYNEFIELREEKKKLVNSNKEELEKIGYNDWIYKDYLINKRVEWNMHDSEGVLYGLGNNESIIAIGTKSYCKEIQNNEAKEEYEYYINPSKTEKGLYVLREVWLGYYLKSGGNIDDFTYDIGGL